MQPKYSLPVSCCRRSNARSRVCCSVRASAPLKIILDSRSIILPLSEEHQLVHQFIRADVHVVLKTLKNERISKLTRILTVVILEDVNIHSNSYVSDAFHLIIANDKVPANPKNVSSLYEMVARLDH